MSEGINHAFELPYRPTRATASQVLNVDQATFEVILHHGPHGRLLALALDSERGNWAAVENSGPDPGTARNAYLQALAVRLALPG